jgi:hypothetical protein
MRFMSFIIVVDEKKKTAIVNMSQIEYIIPTEIENRFLFKFYSGDHLIVEIDWAKLIRLYNLRQDIKQYV